MASARPPNPLDDRSCKEVPHDQVLDLFTVTDFAGRQKWILRNLKTGEVFVRATQTSLHFTAEKMGYLAGGETVWCSAVLQWSVWRTGDREFAARFHDDGAELQWIESFQEKRELTHVDQDRLLKTGHCFLCLRDRRCSVVGFIFALAGSSVLEAGGVLGHMGRSFRPSRARQLSADLLVLRKLPSAVSGENN